MKRNFKNEFTLFTIFECLTLAVSKRNLKITISFFIIVKIMSIFKIDIILINQVKIKKNKTKNKRE